MGSRCHDAMDWAERNPHSDAAEFWATNGAEKKKPLFHTVVMGRTEELGVQEEICARPALGGKYYFLGGTGKSENPWAVAGYAATPGPV